MKSMKKLVLVGLVLLASVLVLLPLVGCKREVDPEVKEPPYLTFKADSEQTLTMKIQEEYTLHESLQYSVGGGEWKQLQAETAISFGGAAGDLRMRGKSAGGTGIYNNGDALFTYISFGNSEVKVACTGDIRTLVNYESYSTADTSVAVFTGLFSGCTSLSSAPALPAETLAEGCYWGMFYGCTSLSSAPALPAETLAEGCYYSMFFGCTSLSSAPALPAETLAEGCYAYLFSGCTSLSSAPALPAESLAPYCYSNMFSGCTSLSSAPALPAETLAEECYSGMFSGCTSLSSAPALPAESLAPYCYSNMFSGCTSLSSAPALPAETLAEECYYEMFSGCTSLTSAPALPAESLAPYCYCEMFEGCTKLSSVTMLATDISAYNCLQGWLDSVSETGTFTKAAAMNEETLKGYIPSGWTVQNYVPQQ